MQEIYVNMQDYYVNMQVENQKMKIISIYCAPKGQIEIFVKDAT